MTLALAIAAGLCFGLAVVMLGCQVRVLNKQVNSLTETLQETWAIRARNDDVRSIARIVGRDIVRDLRQRARS